MVRMTLHIVTILHLILVHCKYLNVSTDSEWFIQYFYNVAEGTNFPTRSLIYTKCVKSELILNKLYVPITGSKPTSYSVERLIQLKKR